MIVGFLSATLPLSSFSRPMQACLYHSYTVNSSTDNLAGLAYPLYKKS